MDFRDHISVFRRRWPSVVVCLALAIAGGALLTLQMTPQYASTIRLFVSPPQGGSATTVGDPTGAALAGIQLSEQRIASYADLIAGPEVANQVAYELSLDQTPEALRSHITASVVPETVILRVTVTDPDPRQASRIAAAVGRVFSSYVAKLETPAGLQRPMIRASMLAAPVLESEPVSPRPLQNVGIAAVLGLFLGIGLGGLREVCDRSIRTSKDLAEVTSAPALGAITLDRRGTRRPIGIKERPHSVRMESFRVLRTNLQFAAIEEAAKTFVITSSVPGEGKTTTACNLAIALAQAGPRVILVDADLRRPKVASYLRLGSSPGLAGVLLGETELSDAICEWGDDGLHVLPIGTVAARPAELLSRRMGEVLGALRESYDIVLVDAPPLLPVTDAALLAAQADGTVLIVRHRNTTRDQVRQSLDRLAWAKARLIGQVLNMAPRGGDHDPSYTYRSYAPPRAARSGRWFRRKPSQARRPAQDSSVQTPARKV